jgi:hypothetical protein
LQLRREQLLVPRDLGNRGLAVRFDGNRCGHLVLDGNFPIIAKKTSADDYAIPDFGQTLFG